MGLTSALSTKNEVCCMFASCRYYGFPGSFLAVCKTTDSYAEAEKVNHTPTSALLEQGWRLHFAGNPLDPLPGPSASLFVDSALALLLGAACDAVFMKLIDRRKKYAENLSRKTDRN